MDLGLAGKNVIVTGASRGIGRATALQFAKEGANVAICARGLEALEKTEQELQAHGGAVFAKSCDVSDMDALTAFLGEANNALGGVDILINNPSGFGPNRRRGWLAGRLVGGYDGKRAGSVASHTLDGEPRRWRDSPYFINLRFGDRIATSLHGGESGINCSF